MDLNINQNPISSFRFNSQGSRNLAIELVLLILFGGLFFWFIVLPKRASITDLEANLSTVQKQQQDISGELNSLKNLANELNNDTADINHLDQALPLNGKTMTLQILAATLAQSVGVTIKDTNAVGPNNQILAGDKALLAKPYGTTRALQKISGSISVLGTFSQLEAFLRKLETSGRLINIGSLTIDSAEDGNLSLKVTMEAYYLAP
ncbi:MAG TPA: hypothetical protein VE973_04135 [Candidatus Limnocylindria bacterium]|nr:hypothetical protein [Candidatus Limnocylindria bacterium]